jgi:hypothetical protein
MLRSDASSLGRVNSSEPQVDISTLPIHELQALLVAEREAAQARLATSDARIAMLEKERDHLLSSHERLSVELALFKRRLFIAKAERADDERQLRIEFDEKLRVGCPRRHAWPRKPRAFGA